MVLCTGIEVDSLEGVHEFVGREYIISWRWPGELSNVGDCLRPVIFSLPCDNTGIRQRIRLTALRRDLLWSNRSNLAPNMPEGDSQ